MARGNYYRLYFSDTGISDHRVKASSPAAGLRALVAESGLTLTAQDGRYGTVSDGRRVIALTEPWGRVDGPDARTTRIGAPR